MSYDILFKNKFSRNWSRGGASQKTASAPKPTTVKKAATRKPAKKVKIGREEILGYDEILGEGRMMGEEEMALACEGAAEYDAIVRSGFNSHTQYI